MEVMTVAPPGGAIASASEVSSSPRAPEVQWLVPPLSEALASLLRQMALPVPYSTCPDSKGSMASAVIQCPVLVPTYGAPEASRCDLSASAFQVVPPSLVRYTSSSGHHRSRVVTITVDGFCASTDRPENP